MLKRYGCGCVYLETGDGHGRLIAYCGASDDSPNPRIGANVRISDAVLERNMPGVPVTETYADALFTRLAELIRKGRSAETLGKALQSLLE